MLYYVLYTLPVLQRPAFHYLRVVCREFIAWGLGLYKNQSINVVCYVSAVLCLFSGGGSANLWWERGGGFLS